MAEYGKLMIGRTYLIELFWLFFFILLLEVKVLDVNFLGVCSSSS